MSLRCCLKLCNPPHVAVVRCFRSQVVIKYDSIAASKDETESRSSSPSIYESDVRKNISGYQTWSSLKDVNTKVGVLLYQAVSLPANTPLLPRQAYILPLCISFWKNAFPKCEDVMNSITDNGNLQHLDRTILSQFLTKVYIFNCKMAAFADVSVAAGEFTQFLRVCDTFRSSKTRFGLESGQLLLEPKIYEALSRHFAAKADWLHLSQLLHKMEQEKLKITPRIYLNAFECLGRLLSDLSAPKATNIANLLPIVGISFKDFVPFKTSMNPKDAKRKVTQQLHVLLKKAEAQGLNLNAELLQMPRLKGSMEHTLFGLQKAKPKTMSDSGDIESNFFPEDVTETVYAVERNLQNVKHKMRNSFASAVPNERDLIAAFEQQLSLERKGEVRIPPILSPFPPRQNSQGKLVKKQVSEKLKKRLRQGLMDEQNLWRVTLLAGFKDLLERLKKSHSLGKVTAYPFFKILPATHYVDLMIKAIDQIALDSTLQHVNSRLVCLQLGERVESACDLYRKEKAGVIDELRQVYTEYAKHFCCETMSHPQFRLMWQSILHERAKEGAVTLHQDWPQWTPSIHYMVGKALYSVIYDRLTFDRHKPTLIKHQPTNRQNVGTNPTVSTSGTTQSPVLFEVLTELIDSMRTEIRLHPTLAAWYRDADYPPLSFSPAELPILCPPIPWISLADAGYLISRNYSTRFMRRPAEISSSNPVLNDDLDFDAKRIPSVLDALNCLAACPWRVNEPILDDLIEVARSGGNRRLSIPETIAHKSPTPPAITQSMTQEERRSLWRQAREAQKHYDESRSLWATELYRLSIANQYRGRVFWFPHSMDFRGRVYPCPPHFHHMGSDVARGLIVFATGLPLGDRGLDWLKIHLVNLTGLKKRCSNAERLQFADTILDEVFDSARNPFNGRRWWQEQDEPWQTLACCRELVAALEHEGGPNKYISHFPVHQDGSCNGLQHYAALGRDRRGAESVNLTDSSHPQDVYSDVVEVVEEQRRIDAAAGVAVAQVLEGFIRRKVIKQSVMTTVYGVTLYGASEQIRRQLLDLDNFPGREWIGPAAAYLARATLASIGAIFTSSTEIQAWFGQIAHHVSRHMGRRVSWESPLGLPIRQPYMRQSGSVDKDDGFLRGSSPALGTSALQLATRLARSHVSNTTYFTEISTPNTVKQKNAFPPNFVHSLDSCHMMLTALHCLREGITFASVHDCFWTHAATVDTMNRICRDEFIALHSEPILHNFAEYLRKRFAYTPEEISNMSCELKKSKALSFNTLLDCVPKPGTFDLNEIRNSTYFFS